MENEISLKAEGEMKAKIGKRAKHHISEEHNSHKTHCPTKHTTVQWEQTKYLSKVKSKVDASMDCYLEMRTINC